MRIVACTRRASSIHLVWHCELVRSLTDVQWIDDETMQYGQYDERMNVITKQAKKIVVTRHVVFINPPDDVDPEVRQLVERETEMMQ